MRTPFLLAVLLGSGAAARAQSVSLDNGTLSLTAGTLDLSANALAVGTAGTLAESGGRVVTTGAVTATRTLDAPAAVDVGGLGLTITSAAALGTTTVTRRSTAVSVGGVTSVARTFTVAPATNTALDATVAFAYDTADLGATGEGALVLFSGSDVETGAWSALPTTRDAAANTLTATGLSSLAAFAAAPAAAASVATTVATSGWRVLAPPVGTLTVRTLAGLNLVQGLSDEFATFNPNLFTSYTGNGGAAYAGFTLPAATSDALALGRGFLWYFFATGGPGAGDERGTSRRAALPLTLAATGSALTASTAVTFAASDRSGATNDFYLLGNPFAQGFDLSGVSATSGTLSNAFQIWNGTSWVTKDRLVAGTAEVAVWQGFFAEVTGPTFPLTFAYDYGAATGTSPVLVGKGGPAAARLGLRLSGTAPTGAAISDEAAALVARDGAALGWDADDASKLDPLSGPGFTVGLVGDKRGAAVVQAQRSVPEALSGPLEVPLRLAVPAAARLTLSWGGAATLPPAWRVALVDRRTGAEIDVRADTAYVFDATTADADRLALVLRPGAATGIEAPGPELAADALVVSSPYPQPARASVRLTVEVGSPQRVSADVYDVLGRRVAVLFDGPLAAQAPERLDLVTSALPAGTYVVRVRGERAVVSRTFVVLR